MRLSRTRDPSIYLLTGLDNGSIELIRHLTTSPSRISTAPGVPVEITTPGSSVMPFEWNEIRNHSEKIMFETVFSLLTSSFSTVATSSSPTSPTSSGVTRCGRR